MKTIVLITLFLLCHLSVLAQTNLEEQKMALILNKSTKDNPNRWGFRKYTKTSLKSAQHKSSAKKYLKKGDNEYALHHFFLGLSKTEKKGQIKRFQKTFDEGFVSDAVNEIDTKVDSIKNVLSTQEFITKAETQLCYIKYLSFVQELHDIKLSSKNLLACKTPSFDQASLDKTKEEYTSTKAEIAPYYYEVAKKKEATANTKDDWKKVSSYYAIAQIYDENYKDAKEKEVAAVEKSIFEVAVSPEVIQSSEYRRLDKSLQSMIKSKLVSYIKKRKLRHIRIVPENGFSDFRINLTISDIIVEHKGIDSNQKHYKREIVTGKDKEDKEIKSTVTANVTYYNKQSNASLKIFAEIINNATREIFFSETFNASNSWYTRWYKLSGNKKALSKRENRFLPVHTQEENTPPNKKLIQNAIDNKMNAIGNNLNSKFIYIKGNIGY